MHRDWKMLQNGVETVQYNREVLKLQKTNEKVFIL